MLSAARRTLRAAVWERGESDLSVGRLVLRAFALLAGRALLRLYL